MKRIDIQGVGLVDFPDSMTDAEITAAIETDILKISTATPAPKSKGLLSSIGDAFTGAVESLNEFDRNQIAAEEKKQSVATTGLKQSNTGFNYNNVENILPSTKADNQSAARIKQIGTDVDAGFDSADAAQNAFTDQNVQTETARNQFNADADKATKELLSNAQELKDKPKRSLGDVYGDLGNTALKVAPTAIKMGAEFADFITLGSADLGVQKYLEEGLSGMDKTFGSDTFQYEKEEFADLQKTTDFGDKVQFFLRNPMYMIDAAGTSMGSMAIPVGTAASILKIAGAIKPSLTIQTARALQAGTVASTVALQNAASTFNSDELKDLPMDQRYEAAAMTAILTLATNKVFGGGLDKAIADKLGDFGAKQGLALALKEGGQEAGESTSQSFSIDAVAPDKMTLAQGLNQAATEGLLGTVAGGGFALADMGSKAKSKLTISQGSPEDDATAAALQAKFDAESAKQEADAALAGITEANTVEDAILLANEALKAPVNDAVLLNEINQSVGAVEALPAMDLLEDSNVSDLPSDAATSVVAEATQATGDNVQGSVDDLSLQSDGRGVDNVTEAPTPSLGSDLPAINGTQGNDAVALLNGEDAAARPFAQATDDFLPKMRSMTTDAKVISQIDAELALRGIAPVTASEPATDTTTVPADTTTVPVQSNAIARIGVTPKNAQPVTIQDGIIYVGNEAAIDYETGDEVKATGETLDDIKSALTSAGVLSSRQKVFAAEGSKPAKKAQPKKDKTLLATLRDLGGVANSEKLDITGEQRGFAPGGYNRIFKKDSKRSLKGLIESGDLDDYLPYNMRLEANGANDEAFDSTEAYDYLADKIRNGEGVLPYEAQQELDAARYQAQQEDADPFGDDEDIFETSANALTDDDVERLFNETANDETREDNQLSQETNTSDTQGISERSERAQSEQSQVTDLLGDNTAAKQALANAERAKDAKRNSGTDNQDAFTLTGSNSEADQAAAAGAQSLFDVPTEKLAPGTRINGEVEKYAAVRLEQLLEEINKTNDAKFFSRGEPLTNAKNQIQSAIEELRKSKTVSSIEGMLAQSSSALSKNYGALANVVDEVIQSLEGKAAPAETKPADTQKAKDDTRFANNKIFTADKVAAARARLKSKLNTLNSGIDPELMMDGITIAGAYLETGVRKFSDYAKAMTEDFGDSIKPYLLSFYEAARAYPGIDKDGMTDQETAAAEHQALLTPAVLEQAKEVIGQGVVSTLKAKAKPNGQLKLTQDWGVDDINGYDSDRDDGRGGEVKDAFLSEAKKYLVQVEKLLEAQGFEPHKDQRGRLQKAVSVNESGIATSGEVSLTMRKGNAGVYVDIGTSAIRGVTGNHPQGVSVMIRATDKSDTDRYATKGQNIWLSTDLSSTELANKLMQTAERYVKNTEQAEEGNQNARVNQTEQVQPRGTQSDLLTEQPRNSDSEPMDARMGRESEGTDAGWNVQSGVSETSGNRAPSTSGSNRDDAPSGSRETSNAGNSTGTANDVNDFEITDSTSTGEGSAAQKYANNIAAIKIIKTLDAEKRLATPEEREQLAKYAGFGALSKVFEKNNPKYQELKDLLTSEEYDAARSSILNAYFTSPTIVKTMYEGIAQIGFKNGRVLEPSMGSGNFFGMMPAAMRNKSQLNGVELDVITSRIAKHLYPKANVAVATGFENYEAPEGYFDLVISNPPFGSEKLTDTAKRGYSGFSIHNYFIAKSIDKLRDGGVMAVVVSHNFMDAQNSAAREWIAKRANLLGAVRLPKEAFKDIAGTEVITDILYFQKTSTPQANPDWLNATNNGDYSFNDYFYANPRKVLGRIVDTTNQFGKTFTIESVSGNGTLAQQLKAFNESLPQGVYVEPTQRIEVLDTADNTVPDGVKVGTFYVDGNGTIRQRMTDILGAKRSVAWEVPNAKAKERMAEMMNLRDLLRSQMRFERDAMATEKEIEANRVKLNRAYDKFLKEYGYLNSMTNRRLFIDDTESALLQALELDYDQGVTKAKSLATGMEAKEPSAQKADIFNRRVLFPPSDSIIVNNAQDALLQSLDAKGGVDIDYMAEVYNKPAAEIVSELGDVVFNDPVKGYVTADEYLSGDVKTKLVEAKTKALSDKSFSKNVEALEKVIPKDKLPSEIFASPGANWIPADVYESFATEITGIPKNSLEFTYVPAAATWLSDKTNNGDAGKMTADYGTSDLNAFQLFTLLINGRSAEVKKTVASENGGTKQVADVEKTDAANAKYQKIKEFWDSWVFSDPERADRLASIYNEKHNRIVARAFDGSHMNFYGMSPAIKLIQSQKNVVWRAIQDRNVLFDHVVGAGKTFAMAATAMEMKRLGIARKPMFVVPNHLTLQWRSEFTRLYPASNILAATPDDFSKDKREKMFSKMVTGGYDAIIIGHSSLTKVGLPAEIEEKMYNEQVKEIADAIEQAKTARGDRGITRDMEKIKQNLENKIKKLKEKAGVKDNVVTWDELGIDGLFIDEMHEFKNLFFTTQMQRTAGLGNPAGSGKALDLFMKVRHMQQTIGENAPLITATGTPVSNSLAEMFTMQRYMKYDHMKRSDLHLFDAWAKQYGEIENVYEVAPSGVGYRQSTRFSKFKNLPSLMANYTSFADVITLQDLKDQSAAQGKVFPVPKIKTGKPVNVIAQRSDLQRDYFGIPKLDEDEAGNIKFELNPDTATIEQNKDGAFVLKHESGMSLHESKEKAEFELVTKALMPKTFLEPSSLLGKFANLAELTRSTKGKVNALSLTGLANKAGLDFRIINPSAPDFKDSKINMAVGNMVTLWKDTAKDKGTQIVFCDMSVPASARTSAASKERYALIRDRNNLLAHKKATLHTVDDYEGFPFYISQSGSGETKSFAVYEPLSGLLIRDGLNSKQDAKGYMESLVSTDNGRDSIFAMRDRMETITKDDIDEYFAEQEKIEIADDGSNLITPEDLESIAGSSKFSVYDDIKAKLINNGVPELEIAFIHDFNTPKQKEELFKRVNKGEVRFLFGSTPKLGAGTNVQKRLVGLHHIDAPWRPSDLEQREGRIIRQGNELYARDPEGFEISIWRYATEQTYDTRRWQLLEHKASGIEQLRKYSGEAEIEDVAGEASNSADMKAAASGNPLVLEETKLRTEVKRLQNLEKAHADSKFSMLRKIKENERAANEYLPRKIAEYKSLISNAMALPVPKDKEKIALTIVDGQRFTDKAKAEDAIGLLGTRVRQAFNMGEVKTINYRGIDFTVERGFSLGTLKLMSPDGTMGLYGDKDSFSASGLITRFNNYIDSFNGRIDQANAAIAAAEKENSELKPRLNDPFEQADLLKAMQARHDSVKRKLMKSTQLEAVPEGQRNKFNSLLEQRKQELIKLGYEDALNKAEKQDDDTPMFSRGAEPRTPFVAQQDESYIPTLNNVIAMFKSGNQQKIRDAGKTPVPISRTPVVLRQVIEDDGSKPFKRSDFVVGQGSTLYLKADNVHSRSIHTGRISKDVLDSLPKLLADPIAVFKSSSASEDSKSFKVLLDAVDENGDPVIVAIKPNVPMQQLNNAPVNFQATIFPATWDKVREWNKDGLLRYYNEKSPRTSRPANNPLGTVSELSENTREDFDANIGVSASKVKVVTKGNIENMPESAFSRESNLVAAGLPKAAIKKAVNLLKSNWKNAPEIIVVQDMSDPAIRDAVRAENERQLSQGAKGQPEAFFDNGKVYVVASEMNSADDVIRVVFHEALGHYGLRGLYGKELGSILDQIALLRKRDMDKKAAKYGLAITYPQAVDKVKKKALENSEKLSDADLDKRADALRKSDTKIAAEEVLAEMAQTAPSAGFVKRAIAAIRKFLRDIGFSIELSDNDIVANYLMPARNYVVKEAKAKQEIKAFDMAMAFNREESDNKIELIKKDAIAYAKDNFAGNSYINKSDGSTILVGNQGIKHAMSGKVSEISAVALTKLDEILINSQFVRSEPDKAGRNTIKEIRFYQAPVELQGIQTTLEVVVRVASDGNRYYDHFEIKNPAGQLGKSDNQNSTQPFTGLVSLDDSSIISQTESDVNQGTSFSRSNPQGSLTPESNTQQRVGNSSAPPEETASQAAQRVIQDKFNRFKVIQDWVKTQGINLSEAADVYLAETLMSGRISTRKENFREDIVQPLIKKTQEANISMEEIGEFLKAQHAPEANRRARELQGVQDATAYGVSDADAENAMTDFKALPYYNELRSIANEWRSITNETKQIKLNAGLLTDEMAKAWEETYDVYIPVKGNDETGAKQGTGKGLNVRDKNKMRLGHGLRDEAIIENILRDHETAITLDEKNRVGKALIKFALEVQNENIITIDKPVKRKVLKKGETAYVVTYQGLDIASFDTSKEANLYIQAQSALGRTRSDFAIDTTQDPVRVMLQASPQLADNEVTIYVAGHAVRLQINDEIAAREYKNMGVEHLNTILSAGREVNNWLSKAYTGYSPDFIFTNPIRDAIQGAITLTGNEGIVMAGKIFANYPNAIKELVKYFKDKNSSELVNEYRNNGGSTGAAYLSDLERIGNDIESSFNEYQGALQTYKTSYEKQINLGRTKKAAHTMALLKSGAAGFKKIPVIGHFLRLMERLNSITENALRVATYKTLRDSGQSKLKAAAQAKNLMNFNRKGEQSNAAGALYLFFNPSVQGTHLIYEALTNSPHKRQAQALAGSMALAGFTLAMMALNGDDEDKEKWKKTPDYIKDGNIVINMMGVQLTLTLPYGYRVFWGLGNIMADATQKGADFNKLGIRLVSNVFENFSPIGNLAEGENGVFQGFPTSAKMILAPGVNEDGFGRPVTPKRWKESTPDSQLMNRGTVGSLYDGVSSKLNDLTGGSKYEAGLIDVSPETLKFWVRSLTGGAGQFVIDSTDIVASAAQGVAPQDPRNIPIARKFVRTGGVSDARSAFWEIKNEADIAREQLSAAMKERDADAVMDLRDRKGVLATMAKKSNLTLKMANIKRNAIAKIKADKDLSLKEKQKLMLELEAEETAIYDKFIEIYNVKIAK